MSATINELPEEVRLYIFRLATLKVNQEEDTSSRHCPFESVSLKDRDWSKSAQIALSVKLAVIQVCKEWKRIATEMLYECIRIQHGTDMLLEALKKRSAATMGYDHGQWVHRIEISSEIADFDPFNPAILCHILACCPSVEVIVRSCVLGSGGAKLRKPRLPLGTTFPILNSLKRIDWWLSGVGESVPMHISGFLEELLSHSPNLDYLTLSGFQLHPWTFSSQAPLFLAHETLTTLRLESYYDVEASSISLVLPNLTRLIHGGKPALAQQLSKVIGPQIRVLEVIEIDSSATPSYDSTVKELINAFPNLEELIIPNGLGPVLLTKNFKEPVILNSLQQLRFNFDHHRSNEQVGIWVCSGLISPYLQHIILHGGTRAAWEQSECFPHLLTWASGKEWKRHLEIA